MEYIDVFNGDADGILALHQLRLHQPLASRLVSGPKRDIHLLAQLQGVHQACITVLDVSLAENRRDLLGLLERGCQVTYFDHHYAGEVPQHPALTAHLDMAVDVCTSLLVDRHLGGKYRLWAIAAAFGDNLVGPAVQAARQLGLSAEQQQALCRLGELVNYNGYGETLEDLLYPPQALYQAIHPHHDPFEFVAQSPELSRIEAVFQEDMAQAESLQPLWATPQARLFVLPAQPWVRRAVGVFANRLTNQHPTQAHALLAPNQDGTYKVSLRAPQAHLHSADVLCRAFEGGGGRAGAGGIPRLPKQDVERFWQAMTQVYR